MEEKERYEVISPSLNGYAYIHDFKTDNVLNTYDSCDLLNQQSNRIKELEEELDDAKRDYIPKLEFGLQRANKMCRDAEKENQQLKDQARKAYQEGLLQKQFDKDMEIQELKDKIETLKQSQKQLAIEELRRIKEYILINDKYDEEAGCNIIETFDLLEEIRDRIEKLGGGENEWYFKWKLFKTK